MAIEQSAVQLSSIEKLLLYPGVVAVAAACLAYLYRQVAKRRTVSAMLETEINHLLRTARENLDFLDRPDHYWLKLGHVLKSAPKPFSPQYRVFDAVIGDLYILGRDRASNVLAFYEYHAFCENLRESLYARVQEFKDTGQALTEDDVQVLRRRLERLCSAYRTLDGQYPETVQVRALRSSYQMPNAQAILKALAAGDEQKLGITRLKEKTTDVPEL